jgi:hypothetical protein
MKFDVTIGFKIILLDCVIGRRRITIQPPPSSLAKRIILKPICHQGIGNYTGSAQMEQIIQENPDVANIRFRLRVG